MSKSKKYLALIIAFIFLFNCSSAVFAQEQNVSDLTSLSFNSYATNEVPSDLVVNAQGYYIKEYSPQKKGLMLNCGSAAAALQVSASAAADFTVSFELAALSGAVDGSVVLSDGSAGFEPLKLVKEDTSVRVYDNQKIGSYSKSKSTKIDISVTSSEKTYSVYINNKPAVVDYYAPKLSLSSFSSLKLNFLCKEEGGWVVIDNINIHSGSVPQQSYVEAPYNEEVYDEPVFEDEEEGSLVITNEGFEEDTIALSHETGNNVFEIIKDENGNGVLSVEKLKEARALFASSLSVGDIDRIIIEYKIKLLEKNSNFDLCQFKSETGEWSTNVNVRGGNMKGKMGTQTYALPLYVWTKLSFAFSLSGKFFDIYVNDELFEASVPWDGTMNSAVSEVRLSLSATKGYVTPAKFYVDDYRVYQGKVPREVSPDEKMTFPPFSILPGSDAQDALMKDRVGLHLRSGVLYANQNRTQLDVYPYIENDRTMIPVRAVSEAFGFTVSYDVDKKEIAVGNDILMTIGNSTMLVNGNEVPLELAPQIKEGRTFLPLRDFCEKALGKYVYYDNSVVNGGMIIIGDTEFVPPASEAELQKLNNYLMFLRPSAQWLSDKLEESGYANVHPRLFVDKDSIEVIKEEIKTDPVKKSWYEKLVSECERYKTIPLPDYGTYDGTRMSRAPAEQAAQMGFLYLLTGDKAWVDAAWPKLERVCSWKDWNPDREFLDNAQFSLHVATAYDWMYNALTEEQRTIVEEALYDKCIIEAKKWWYGIKGPKDKWQIGTANWNPVCNSGISIGALSVLDVYPEEAGEIISLCTRGLEYVSTRFAPDGAWFEGPAYWDFVFRLLTRYIAAFDKIYNTSFGIDKFEGLDRAASTLLYSQSENGTFNYSDADVEVIYPDTLYYLANHYDQPAVTAITLGKTNAQLSASLYAPYALAWYDTSDTAADAAINLPYDSVFSGDGAFAVMRDSWYDKNGTYVGIKAGKAVYNHSHLDLGSFIYETEGVRWAIDLGKDNYNLPSYWASNDKRWYFYRLRAEGHNTIVISPDDTGIDMNLQAIAKITEQKSSAKGAITVVDMTEALSDNATAAKRGFYLTDNRKSLVVRDEIKLKKPTDELYWTMHTQADSAQIDGSKVIISSAGKKLLAEFESNSDFEIMFVPAKAMEGKPTVVGENQNAGINKLMLKVKGSGNVNITAKLTPLDIMSTDISEYNIPIDEWKLSEGEINTELYLPDAIYIDGEKCEGYSESNRSMVVNYVDGVSELPKITAESSKYRVEVIQPKSFDDVARIRVFGNDDYYTQYIVSFRQIPKPTSFDGYTSLNVFGVEASDVPQPLNHEYNAIDGDLDSRWSAESADFVWLKLDLGKVSEFDTLMLATYLGNKRTTQFSVDVSEDDSEYTEVFSGITSGITLDFEPFELGSQKARYVKIKFYGTSEGTWSSPTDVVIAKKE